MYKSAGNTTTSPLGSGETFTGVSESSEHSDVMVSCETDNTGTLYFDFSNDGENFSTFPPNGFSLAAGVHEFHTAVKGPRGFRVRLVNDSGAQTYLRLHTYYGEFRQGNLPINASISSDADAAIVRTVSSELDLAFGKFSGMSEGRKFGFASSLGNAIVRTNDATWVDVWAVGGKRTAPTGTFTPYVASSSSSDTDVDVLWTYQDSNGLEQTVSVNLDGQTPVSLGVTASELYSGRVTSSTAAVGNIRVTSANNFTNGVPDNQSEILAGFAGVDGRTQVLAGRVPSNVTRRIKYMSVYLGRDNGSEASADVVFQIKRSGGSWETITPMQITTSSPFNEPVTGVILPSSCDYRVRIRDISDNTCWVTGNIHFDDLEN